MSAETAGITLLIKQFINHFIMAKNKLIESKFKKLKVGDNVRVMDQGLLMLQQFAPKGAKQNNEGVVSEIWEDGNILVEFPIGDDDTNEHSQCAPYHERFVYKIT